MIKRKIDLGYKYEAGKGEGHSEPVGGIMHTKHEIQEGNMMAKKAIYKEPHVQTANIVEFADKMANRLKAKVTQP